MSESEEDDEVCEECGGEGSVSTAANCSKPMGDCCGGCTKPCPVCCPRTEQEWDADDEADRRRELERDDPLEY